MAPAISLRVRLENGAVKTLQFDPELCTYEACKIINEKLGSGNNGKDHSLFFPDEDDSKGRWLDAGRSLDFYDFKSGDLIEYKRKHRPLKVKLIDGSIKTNMIDDSLNVGEVVASCCERMGIGNPEEFSFVIEAAESGGSKDTHEHGEKMNRSDKLMKKLRDKLHTDDDFKWLNHHLTLREQGVTDNRVVVLRKKFFFSDVNVDPNDPVQLGLLYVQARSDIMSGVHPCSQEEACQQAALQCQIVMGDYNGDKKLELSELVPTEYAKIKNLQLKIQTEHKKFLGMSELNAKYRYVQLCRSLQTYGVTFFLVKEKLPGKNKLVPRLLGIDRESVMRVDEKSKEVLKTWNLSVVRRWAASPTTFTLDFGDYSEAYYTVQTKEGDQIAALMSGYVDIIVKKQHGTNRDVPEDEGEDGYIEDNVGPQKASAFQFLPANGGQAKLANVALAYDANQGQASMRTAQLTPMQSALQHNLKTGFAAVNAAKADLAMSQPLPPLGNDATSIKWKKQAMDNNLHILTSNAESHGAMAASLLSLTIDPSNIDYTKVGGNITTMSGNLSAMSHAVKKIATLIDDPNVSTKLLAAAKELTESTGGLLSAFQSDYKGSRAETIQQVAAIGANIKQIQSLAGEARVSEKTQEELLQLAKMVKANAIKCVGNAQSVASNMTNNPQGQQNIINNVKTLNVASGQALAVVKALAPLMTSPMCRTEMIEAANLVSKSLAKLKEECLSTCTDHALNEELEGNTKKTEDLLDTLRNRIRGYRGEAADETSDAQMVQSIMVAMDNLMAAQDGADLTKHARDLITRSASLASKFRSDAQNEEDGDRHRRLLEAATGLVNATQGILQSVRQITKNPSDPNARESLGRAVDTFREAVKKAALDAYQQQLLMSLENKARTAASLSTQLVSAARGSESTNANAASKSQLRHQVAALDPFLSALVSAVREHHESPKDASKQLNLINASRTVVQPAARLVAAAKVAVPSVRDAGAAMQLTQFAKQTTLAISELKLSATEAAEACSSLEIDAGIITIRGLGRDLAQAQEVAQAGKLLPLPGDSAEASAMELGASSHTLASSIAQLLSAANQGNENYTGAATRDASSALKIIASACRAMAATGTNLAFQSQVLASGCGLMSKCEDLVTQAKAALTNQEDPHKKQRLQGAADKVSVALSDILNCLPGQRDINAAMNRVNEATEKLKNPPPSTPGSSFEDLQLMVSSTGAQLNVVAGQLVSCARQQPDQLAGVSAKYAESFEELMRAGTNLAGANTNEAVKAEIISKLADVSGAATKLLASTKSLQQDPSAPGVRQLVATASKQHTDAINVLLGMSASAVPGQRECDEAIRLIRGASSYLDNSDAPVSQQTYFQAMKDVFNNTKSIAATAKTMVEATKAGSGERVGESVQTIGKVMEAMIKSAAQAGYLVGAGDPASIPGKAGIVDINEMVDHQQTIVKGCEVLWSPNKTAKDIIKAATDIVKHTTSLGGTCKAASSKTDNPVAKEQFNTIAGSMSVGISDFVKQIKAMVPAPTDEKRENLKAVAQPLLDACSDLIKYSSNAEFASAPAQIPAEARLQQEPILRNGRNLVEASCNYLETTKGIAANKDDHGSWQMFSTHHKAMVASLNSLMNAMKASAPGQRDCLAAIDIVSGGLSELDSHVLDITMGQMQPVSGDASVFQADALTLLDHLDEHASRTRDRAMSDPEKLGTCALQLAKEVLALTKAGAAVASKLRNQEQQVTCINQTKTVAEAALQILFASKKAGGNKEAKDAHAEVQEADSNLKEAATELHGTMQVHAGQSGALNSVLQGVRNDAESMNDPMIESPESGVAAMEKLKRSMRTLTEGTNKVVAGAAAHSGTSFDEACKFYGRAYHNAANMCKSVVTQSSEDTELQTVLKKSMGGIGTTVQAFIKAAATSHESPANSKLKQAMGEKCRVVNEQVANFLMTLQKGSRGVQACDDLVRAINTVVSELDTTVIFASMGQLDPIVAGDKFANYQNQLKSQAAQLINATKGLVMAAVKSQDELAQSCDKARDTITALVSSCKDGAAALSSEEQGIQEMLLASGRSVAKTLADLAECAKGAVGKPANDPIMQKLATTCKRLVGDIGNMSNCIKSVEDETTRGVRSIESAIDAIEQAKKELNSDAVPADKATPEELLARMKMITTANQKVSRAANSGRQDDVIAAANATRRAAEDMCGTAKAAAFGVEAGPSRSACIVSTSKSASATQSLLRAMLSTIGDSDYGKDGILAASRELALAVGESVTAARELKGADWEDPNDPNVIATRELTGAAASIEAAAKKLAELKPRHNANNVNEDLDFDAQILEASKGIAAATAAVVRAATVQQRELVAAGKFTVKGDAARTDHVKESKWRNGLVSAAKEVANATGDLCIAAQSACEGQVGSQDMLVAAARNVSACTTQLLVAATVKSGANDTANERLQAAGATVSKATQLLVAAAQANDGLHNDAATSMFQSSDSAIAKRKQALEAQASMLKAERELEKRRAAVKRLNRKEYEQ